MTTAPSPSLRLQAKLDLVMPDLLGKTRSMWLHPAPRELYLEWIKTLHGMVRATVPLILTALQVSLRREDDTARGLVEYLAQHLREEHGHDRILADDYARANGDRDALLTDPPTPTVAGVVGAQYYWIQHVHPVALLGHIAVLEGYPPSADLAPFLARRTGLAPEAFRTLADHAHLDVGHREELWRLLDDLPLTPVGEALIGLSAFNTVHGLTRLIDEVLLRATGKKEWQWRALSTSKPPVSM